MVVVVVAVAIFLGEGRGGSLCELADAELGESHQFDVIRDLRFLQSRRLGDKDTR